MQVIFHGATQTVTGSLHEIDVAGKRILLDCGLFQGPRALAKTINCCFDFDPKSVDAVILSHGHMDHCGNLPNLVKQGYRGPIYATKATMALTALMLMDSAKIQEEDAAYLNKHNLGRGHVDPLYTVEDAQRCVGLFKPLEYRHPLDLGGVTVEFHDAGHVLGSCCIAVRETATGKTVVFSGDVGRPNSPVLENPQPFPAADLLITECTYGGKTHAPMAQVPEVFARIINETVARNGILMVPAFALGRTQTLIYTLHELRLQKKIPDSLPIFIDSPLANHLTEVFRHFNMLMDDEARALTKPFDFPNLIYTQTSDESRNLNSRPGPWVVIASSGMCEGGRILHHLKHQISNPRNTVLLSGYQAQATLGRKIQDHWNQVPILGEQIPLRAHVEKIDGLSSHADESELLQFVEPLRAKPPRTYLVHGEMDSALAHKAALEARGFSQVFIPKRMDAVEV
jgi:metallo-beta-lactamase family protein